MKVLKTGTEGEPLSGVVFGVYLAADDTELCTLTTGEDGAAVSDTLFYGDYYLKELSTVDGYELLGHANPVLHSGAGHGNRDSGHKSPDYGRRVRL